MTETSPTTSGALPVFSRMAGRASLSEPISRSPKLTGASVVVTALKRSAAASPPEKAPELPPSASARPPSRGMSANSARAAAIGPPSVHVPATGS